MTKTKTHFFCQSCGTPHAQWQGQCHACKSWNTLVEEVVEKTEKAWKEELARLELAVDEGREDGRTEKMLRVAAALVREWMDASVSA